MIKDMQLIYLHFQKILDGLLMKALNQVFKKQQNGIWRINYEGNDFGRWERTDSSQQLKLYQNN